MLDLPPPPRYGSSSIAEVLTSALAALGVGDDDTLRLGQAGRVVVLLVDGLGFDALREHADEVPFLAAHARAEPLDAAFPTTTATSLASLATGRTAAEHGLVGVTVALPGHDRPFNLLRWRLHGHGPASDLSHELVPEEFQPLETLMERAAWEQLTPTVIGESAHEGSALTRALWRGARFVAADDPPALVREAVASTDEGRLTYAYHGRLDRLGHDHGPASQAFHDELVHVDRTVEQLAARLPGDTVLVVTGDHGMVGLDRERLIDVSDEPDLAAGVRLLAGEARVRHIHVVEGATEDVRSAWRTRLGDAAYVVTRAEAIDAGWFGSEPSAAIRARIGDLVVVARADIGIVETAVDPLQAKMVGHHGALTDVERYVPLVVAR